MKKTILASVALFAAGAMALTSCGPKAADIVAAFNKATGQDVVKIDSTKAISMECSMEGPGMSMPMSITARIQPILQMRLQMSAMGMDILAVINGEQGWIVIPGQGVSEIPAEQMKEITGQFTFSSMNNWDLYDYANADSRELNGVKLQGVKMTPKPGVPASANKLENIVVYFNPDTHLMEMVTAEMTAGTQTATAEIFTTDYQKFGGEILIPSRMSVTVPGEEGSFEIVITDYKYNADVPDSLFEKPVVDGEIADAA